MINNSLCVSLTENYYYLPGQQDPLLCGNSSDAGYVHTTPIKTIMSRIVRIMQ